MALYKHVQVRSLTVESFPVYSVPRSSLFPSLTTFFNKVTLHYPSDTDSFREFLLALVEGKKMETLAVVNPSMMTYFHNDPEPFVTPQNNIPPSWLRDIIFEAFYQRQLLHLSISFNAFWASTELFTCLLQDWLKFPYIFPQSLNSLGVLGAPPVQLLRKYGFRTVKAPWWDDSSPFVRRCYILPHVRSMPRILEVTVFARLSNGSNLSNEEFCERAAYTEVRFHFNTFYDGRRIRRELATHRLSRDDNTKCSKTKTKDAMILEAPQELRNQEKGKSSTFVLLKWSFEGHGVGFSERHLDCRPIYNAWGISKQKRESYASRRSKALQEGRGRA
uniref:PMD domain-containing protein n=1 Tax=Steinernema glaseri TaxID=37863 RepID=A0A1I8ARE4_9BILA